MPPPMPVILNCVLVSAKQERGRARQGGRGWANRGGRNYRYPNPYLTEPIPTCISCCIGITNCARVRLEFHGGGTIFYHRIRRKPDYQSKEGGAPIRHLSPIHPFSHLFLVIPIFRNGPLNPSAFRPTENEAFSPLVKSIYKSSCLNFYLNGTRIMSTSVDLRPH